MLSIRYICKENLLTNRKQQRSMKPRYRDNNLRVWHEIRDFIKREQLIILLLPITQLLHILSIAEGRKVKINYDET